MNNITKSTNEHIMNRVTNYVHYATYNFHEGSDWFVDIMMNLKYKRYEVYLFNKNYTVKSFLKSIPFEFVNSDEEIIDQLSEDWNMATFDYKQAFEKQYYPYAGYCSLPDNASCHTIEKKIDVYPYNPYEDEFDEASYYDHYTY